MNDTATTPLTPSERENSLETASAEPKNTAGIQTFEVEITETLQMKVTVEAQDQLEAEQIVTDAWDNGEYILDAESFVGVSFEATPVERDLDLDHDTASPPLTSNEYVQELLTVMQENSVDTGELLAVLRYVDMVERQLDTAVNELTAMRQEMADMREIQNHPVKTAMQNAADALEGKITVMRERLEAVKADIIDGAKNAVAAFKEKGITALHSVASFFNVKDSLQSLRSSLNAGIKEDERAIAAIEAASAKYHEAGRRVKNMGRALTDKEAIRDAKPTGKLGKTLEAPFVLEKDCLASAVKDVDAAIRGMERLEAAAARIRETKNAARTGEKPSILKDLDAFKKQIAEAKKDVPVTGRPAREESSL